MSPGTLTFVLTVSSPPGESRGSGSLNYHRSHQGVENAAPFEPRMPDGTTDLADPVSGSDRELARRPSLPPVCVNWHLCPLCNYRCRFCFATFSGRPETLPL